MMTDRMHLISFLIHSPMNHSIMSWAEAGDERVDGLASMRYWQELGRTLEKGRFDAVFFADVPAAYDTFRDRADETVKYGVCWPTHDPLAAIGIMATATERLGLAVTLSVAGYQPYQAVRTLSTWDYLTGGRVGWNIVTGHLRAEHRALGLEQMPHDERYDRADEYMEVCNALWAGIDPDAIVADRRTGVFADPAKVRRVTHAGRYFRTQAVPPVMPSPQGRPVLFQAGSSGRGQTFAIQHAEVIFAIQPHLDRMKVFMEQVKAAARAAGKPDSSARVTFGVQPILGGTEQEAKAVQKELTERVPIEAALARLAAGLGIDFSTFDLDQPMEEMATEASRGSMTALFSMGGSRRATLREIAMRYGASIGMPGVVGTPEQVADELERLWRESGCFGFNVTPTSNDASVRDFVEQVVPLLQKKGVFRTEYEARTLRENLMGPGARPE